MSAAAIARPRLLRRPFSDAQRQAARRNGAKSCGPRTPAGIAHSSRNARKHGLYAKLHLFTPEEAATLHDESRFLIEAFRPAGPVALALVRQAALASFQLRRIDRIEIDFQTRNPRDFLAIARLIHSLGVIECRYDRLLHRCLCRLERIANEPGNSLKNQVEPASAGSDLRRSFPGRAGASACRQRYTGTKVRPPQ